MLAANNPGADWAKHLHLQRLELKLSLQQSHTTNQGVSAPVQLCVPAFAHLSDAFHRTVKFQGGLVGIPGLWKL